MTSTNEMTGGEALARVLQAHGVGPIFGMGGFQLLPFYDAVRRLGMAHSLISDERNGAFAADAYARMTGRVGVCDATLGPGATNLVTGLVESLNGGTPVVAIVGDTHRAHSWKNMTQEARQLDILRPAVKEVLRVERIERSAGAGETRVHAGDQWTRRTRSSWMCLKISRTTPTASKLRNSKSIRSYEAIPALRCRADAASIDRAADASGRRQNDRSFWPAAACISRMRPKPSRPSPSKRGVPVAHTLSGKGAIACTHPLSAGIFGRYSRIANDLIETADCLLVIGCKLGEIATKRYTVPPAGKTLNPYGHRCRGDRPLLS